MQLCSTSIGRLSTLKADLVRMADVPFHAGEGASVGKELHQRREKFLFILRRKHGGEKFTGLRDHGRELAFQVAEIMAAIHKISP